MLIYACISAHGFGHGSRSAAVLAALHQLRPDWPLVVSTALPDSFLNLALAGVPHRRRPCRWDVGVVQADALDVDPAATLHALADLALRLPAQLEREVRWLRGQAEPVLVLGDVPPAAADLAQGLGAPLIWLASFGWDAIYGAMGEPFAAWSEHCRSRYRQGDLLLRCPLALPMPWGLPERALGLTAAAPRLTAEQARARLGVSAPAERCALISFGGLGLALDPSLLALWPAWTFVGSDPALAAAPNGRPLPPDLRPVDGMPCCSRVITKPGYSTFCEALSLGLGLHLVHREGFAEAAVLERELRRHGAHRLLSQAELRSGAWQLDQPLLAPSGSPLPAGGAEQAARAIAAWPGH